MVLGGECLCYLSRSLSRGAGEVPKLASPFHPNTMWGIYLKSINGQVTLKSQFSATAVTPL